jgi:ketosteroid isomerase-like protein
MGEASEMLERIRAGFSLEAMFGDELASAAIVDGFVAALGSHVSDDFVCVMDGGPMTTSYEGIEGLRRGWEDFLGAFEALQIEPVDAMEGADGTCVVEFVHLKGRPRGIDATIEEDAAAVWRLRDGRVGAVEFYMDRAKALRAGGLEP